VGVVSPRKAPSPAASSVGKAPVAVRLVEMVEMAKQSLKDSEKSKRVLHDLFSMLQKGVDDKNNKSDSNFDESRIIYIILKAMDTHILVEDIQMDGWFVYYHSLKKIYKQL
jgi:hypothetical protein